MSSIERAVPVRLRVFGLPPTDGTATIRERDGAERTKRAAKAAGVCLAFAIATVFIPIAHFVLVPGFLIAAPIFALRRLRERDSIVALTGTCPRCHESRVFEPQGVPGKDVRTTCPVCSFAIEVMDSAA